MTTRLAVLMVGAERPASEGDLAAAGSIGLEAAAFLDDRCTSVRGYLDKCLIRWQLLAKSVDKCLKRNVLFDCSDSKGLRAGAVDS